MAKGKRRPKKSYSTEESEETSDDETTVVKGKKKKNKSKSKGFGDVKTFWNQCVNINLLESSDEESSDDESEDDDPTVTTEDMRAKKREEKKKAKALARKKGGREKQKIPRGKHREEPREDRRGEREGGGNRGERGERGDRGDRGDRGERGERRDRDYIGLRNRGEGRHRRPRRRQHPKESREEYAEVRGRSRRRDGTVNDDPLNEPEEPPRRPSRRQAPYGPEPILRNGPMASETVEITAPPGKLGVTIESGRYGPVVESVSARCPIDVYPGDVIIKVDGRDVSKLNARAVMKMFATRKDKYRNMTILPNRPRQPARESRDYDRRMR